MQIRHLGGGLKKLFERLIKKLLKIINNNLLFPNSLQFRSVSDAIFLFAPAKQGALSQWGGWAAGPGSTWKSLGNFSCILEGDPICCLPSSSGLLFCLRELVRVANRRQMPSLQAAPGTILKSPWEKIVGSYRKLKNSCNTNPLLKVNLWSPSLSCTLKSGQHDFWRVISSLEKGLWVDWSHICFCVL